MSRGGQKSSFGLVSDDWPTIVRGIRACGADASLVFLPSLSSSIFLLALSLFLALILYVHSCGITTGRGDSLSLVRLLFSFARPRQPPAQREHHSCNSFSLFSLRTRQIIFFCQSSSSSSSCKQVLSWPISFVSARNQGKVMQPARSTDILCADALLPAKLLLECLDSVRTDERML